MPISATPECPASHWIDVKQILSDAIRTAGFDPSLVSSADETGVIQRRIIQNLYDNAIIVCDVSCKNPNVMFELGLRLAFDKPTIIVKDDLTSYSFDTAPIEHLEYPRDLRFPLVVEFKNRLAEKIEATHKRAQSDPTYTTFLKHFGEFTVAKLENKEVSEQEFLVRELEAIRESIRSLEITQSRSSIAPIETAPGPERETFYQVQYSDPDAVDRVLIFLKTNKRVKSARVLNVGADKFIVGIRFNLDVPEGQRRVVAMAMRQVARLADSTDD